MALKELFAFTRQQGIVMAFADVFLLLSLMFVVFGVLVWFMRRPAPVAAPSGGH
jgi:DHA2 family multidrug resistance protein